MIHIDSMGHLLQEIGLGTTLSQCFMTLMKGDIHVVRAFGENSRFIITLPIEVIRKEYLNQYVNLARNINQTCKVSEPTSKKIQQTSDDFLTRDIRILGLIFAYQ